MSPSIQYAAQLAHVRELSLTGRADWDYWKERLVPEKLVPLNCDGHAQIMVISAAAKFHGIAFREVSFSVQVQPPVEQPDGTSAFLVQAFNSCRFFAFCERTFFSTPYRFGDVAVSIDSPAMMQIRQSNQLVFRAAMSSTSSGAPREPTRQGPGGWFGSVFLPSKPHCRPGHEKLFYANVNGETLTFPFLVNADELCIRPPQNVPVLQTLVDSKFTGHEWAIRCDANHAKSKTYLRR